MLHVVTSTNWLYSSQKYIFNDGLDQQNQGLDKVKIVAFPLYSPLMKTGRGNVTHAEFGGVCLTVTQYQDHQPYRWASWSFGPPPST